MILLNLSLLKYLHIFLVVALIPSQDGGNVGEVALEGLEVLHFDPGLPGLPIALLCPGGPLLQEGDSAVLVH